ncbi:hypothetical protein COL32_11055 [Bacillus pseudomycoides]|nr:hypothetical protein COL32_11055 [Bacillus pseudomycoides]PGC33491.1 hypothetical protein COM18_25560 [Bacillus pseudomycoides]
MGKIRITYDIEFKKKAVDLYLKEGMGYKTVAKELGIDHSVVRRWVKHFEAERRIDTYGRNEVAHEKPPAWYLQLLLSFKNPFIFVLLTLGILSFFTDDMKGIMDVTVMVTSSATIRFLQEFRSQQAAEKLKKMVRATATVLRTKEFKHNMDEKFDINNNQTLELPIEDLVPGDVIKLSAGDIVPANVRILSAKDLFVNQAALTGEALFA